MERLISYVRHSTTFGTNAAILILICFLFWFCRMGFRYPALAPKRNKLRCQFWTGPLVFVFEENVSVSPVL